MEDLKKDKDPEENGIDHEVYDDNCNEQEDYSETLGDIFVRFLKSSTIRGLPAIVKEPSCGWKFIYLVAVLTFSCVAGYFLKVSISTYLEYKQLLNEEIPKEDRNYFPTITVCDVRDIRVKAPKYWKKFRKERVPDINRFFDQSKWKIGEQRLSFLKRRAINFQFQNYLDENKVNLEEQEKNFIYKCEFTNINQEDTTEVNKLFEKRVEKCNITKYRLQDKTACYIVEKADENIFHPMLNIILYVNNKFTQRMYQYDDLFYHCQATLARVFAHYDTPISKINAYCNGDTIDEATKNILNLNAMIQYHSTTPKTPCLDNPPNIILANGGNYSYTEKRCREAEFQKIIVKTCNCYSHELPIPEEVNIKSLPACLNTNRSFAEYRQAMSCLDRIIQNEGPTCLKPCTDIRYSSSTVVRDWPSFSEGLYFYNSSIKNTGLGKKFSVLKKPLKQPFNLKALEADQVLLDKANKGLDLIGKNFAKVAVKVAVGDVRILRHELSSNWVSVMSKVGGQLYLWIGFTFIAIVEIIQLICDILTFSCSKKDKKQCPKKPPKKQKQPKKVKTQKADFV